MLLAERPTFMSLFEYHTRSCFRCTRLAIRRHNVRTSRALSQREPGANYNNLLSLQWTRFTCPAWENNHPSLLPGPPIKSFNNCCHYRQRKNIHRSSAEWSDRREWTLGIAGKGKCHRQSPWPGHLIAQEKNNKKAASRKEKRERKEFASCASNSDDPNKPINLCW